MKVPTLTLLAALISGPALAGGRPDLVAKSLADPARQHVPTEVLVQFKAGATAAGKARALGKVQGRAAETIAQGAPGSGKGELQLVTLPPGLSVKAALEKLVADTAAGGAGAAVGVPAGRLPVQLHHRPRFG